MFAIAARRLGYRVHVLSPDDDTPTGQVADVEVRAAYDDLTAIAQFARGVSVVTFEFENVPVVAIQAAARFAPVRPSDHVLHTTQDRLREKTFLQQVGLPTTPFQAVHSLADLRRAAAKGLPGILKTAAWGYDGKGQVKISDPAQLESAWHSLGTDTAIFEQYVDFQCELSVVGARGLHGELACFEPIRNEHRNHILDVSVAPSGLPPAVTRDATEIARCVMQHLEVVGVLCVEFFLTRDGRLLINELAPRPHNSGHLTIDAHVTCQFEQQVRAVCGLPLGSTEQLRPAAMANLLGDLWSDTEPDWAKSCALDGVKLHLYGKQAAKPGRKMGHLTALANDVMAARHRVVEARRTLRRNLPESHFDDDVTAPL
jgi:5-(carboxyamino)imidazole ribonucleotide synthase